MAIDLSKFVFKIQEPLGGSALHPKVSTHSSASAPQNRKLTSLQDCPLVLTPVEAARILGIGRNSIYALLRSKQLRSIRVGTLIKIPRAALEEYLNQY